MIVGNVLTWKIIFQSTPSVGRATVHGNSMYPLYHISIHALRGEGDSGWMVEPAGIGTFQSTPSVGRATFFLY